MTFADYVAQHVDLTDCKTPISGETVASFIAAYVSAHVQVLLPGVTFELCDDRCHIRFELGNVGVWFDVEAAVQFGDLAPQRTWEMVQRTPARIVLMLLRKQGLSNDEPN